jgi:uncharacterized protein (DUF1330 family)
MLPILAGVQGYFRYDARINDELKSPASHPINRLFIIGFPDRDAAGQFFSDRVYLEVRKEYFDRAVIAASVLSGYEVNLPQSSQ